MTVFLMHIQRLFRNKVMLITMIVAPSILLGFTISSMQGGVDFYVGVVDNDQTPFTQQLIDHIRSQASVEHVSEGDLRTQLIHRRLDYGIIIPKGYTEQLMGGEIPHLDGISMQETNRAVPIRLQIEQFLNAGVVFAGDPDTFHEGIAAYSRQEFQLQHQRLNQGASLEVTLQGIGYLAFALLFLSSAAAIKIIEDRSKQRLQRLLATPLSLRSYMAQMILGFFVVAVLQLLGILFVMRFLFGLDFGANPGSLVILLIMFALTSVALGVAISSLAKNEQQVGVLSTLLITPMAMLGGCFWPRWVMPQLLQDVGLFVPTTWVVDGATRALQGASIVDLHLEIGVLLLFSLGFFLLGSWRKVDISR